MKYTTLFAALVTLTACGGQATVKDAKDSSIVITGDTSASVGPVADTISIGGVLYDISPSTQAAFDAIRTWTPDTSEQYQLDHTEGLVSRTGDTLSFTLQNGKTARLITNRSDEGDDYAQYDFMGELPGTGQWLTFGVFYESYAYVLISKATGDTTFTIGFPELSPDKKYLVCGNADLEAGFTTNGFGLYKNGAVPELLEEKLVDNWGPEEVKWEDASHLLVKKQVFDPQHTDLTIKYIRLSARK